jgi:hypothetical protein
MEKRKIIELEVARVFDLPEDFLYRRSRKQRYTLAKKAFCMALYYKEEATMEEISDYVKDANHTNALYHIRTGNDLCETMESFRIKVDKVMLKANEVYL